MNVPSEKSVLIQLKKSLTPQVFLPSLMGGGLMALFEVVLAFVPKIVVGGLLCYLGLVFLLEWVVESWFKLPLADAAIILLIVVVIATVGFCRACFWACWRRWFCLG